MLAPNDASSIWACTLLTRRVLEKVTVGLAGAGVDVLAVKGVVTSSWLYDQPSERPLTDVDIRVRPRDLGAVLDTAARLGWRLVRRLHSYRTLLLEVDGVDVDVESRVGPRWVSPLPVDRMFDRATQDRSGVWIPEPHDHAVLLTVNVFKDGMTLAMPWALEDAVRVVKAPEFHPGTYVERVREARVEGLAWVVADWFVRRSGAEGWSEVRALLGGDTPRRWVYSALMGRVLAAGQPNRLGARLITRAASDEYWRIPPCLGAAAAFELETWWAARRRARA